LNIEGRLNDRKLVAHILRDAKTMTKDLHLIVTYLQQKQNQRFTGKIDNIQVHNYNEREILIQRKEYGMRKA
jgi:hypothetical protein